MSKIYEVAKLPNGCSLYVKDDEVGGRDYYTDEVGYANAVWNTSLVDKSTLLAAIVEEERIQKYLSHNPKEFSYKKYLEFIKRQ